MRKICLINSVEGDNELSLSILTKLARVGKRILLVDLKQNSGNEKDYEKTTLSFMNNDTGYEENVEKIEENFYLIKGHPHLYQMEFNLFYKLIKRDFFVNKFKNVKDFDYIVLEISPNLSIINQNAFFFASEIMNFVSLNTTAYNLSVKISRFLYHFNKYYSKNFIF